MEKESFDLESVYDEEIAPLMAQIIETCKRVGMPVFATFNYARNAEEDLNSYCTTCLDDGAGWYPDEVSAAHAAVFEPARKPVTVSVADSEGRVMRREVIL